MGCDCTHAIGGQPLIHVLRPATSTSSVMSSTTAIYGLTKGQDTSPTLGDRQGDQSTATGYGGHPVSTESSLALGAEATVARHDRLRQKAPHRCDARRQRAPRRRVRSRSCRTATLNDGASTCLKEAGERDSAVHPPRAGRADPVSGLTSRRVSGSTARRPRGHRTSDESN